MPSPLTVDAVVRARLLAGAAAADGDVYIANACFSTAEEMVMLRTGAVDDASIAREARALGLLARCPHVSELLDGGFFSGRPALVLRFFGEHTLRDYIGGSDTLGAASRF